MNLSKKIKSLIIGLTLAACINSNANPCTLYHVLYKKGLIKVNFTPLQIGVVGNLFATDNVYGLSFAMPISYSKNNYGFASGVWGESKDLRGVQFNLINFANELNGVQFGLCGIIKNIDGINCELYGAQMNVINISKKLSGYQGGIYNQSERLVGMQSGFINIAIQGLQLGFVNVFNSKNKLKEVDAYLTDARIQIGLYNHSNSTAFQIGALNYNKNGFLPIFPLFNFTLF